MPNFRATDPDGVVTEYTATMPNPAHLGPGWRLEELIEVPPPDDAPPPPVDTRVYGGRRILTKLEFLELFTRTERKDIRRIRNASEDLDDYLYLLEMAQEVNLDSANTQAGVAMLEQAGIIAAGRGAEILNG